MGFGEAEWFDLRGRGRICDWKNESAYAGEEPRIDKEPGENRGLERCHATHDESFRGQGNQKNEEG
jgi:hypothetical protein